MKSASGSEQRFVEGALVTLLKGYAVTSSLVSNGDEPRRRPVCTVSFQISAHFQITETKQSRMHHN